MLTYKAMYVFDKDGVHAEVMDFPGAISSGHDLAEARQQLAGALVDMAESHLLAGEPLPLPNPSITDPEAELEEPIHLFLNASVHVEVVAKAS